MPPPLPAAFTPVPAERPAPFERAGRFDDENEGRESDRDRRPRDLDVRLDEPPRGRGIAIAARIMLIINVVADLVLAAGYGIGLSRLAANPWEVDIDEPDIFVGLGILGHLLLLIPTGILFLIWFVKAYGNADRFGARGLTASAGWAAGYFFIPFMNLFRPYTIAQETWKASDPEAEGPDGWRSRPGSWLVRFWWAAWLIGLFTLEITARISDSEPLANRGGDGLRVLFGGMMIALLLFAVAGVLLTLFIGAVVRRQEEKWQALHEAPADDYDLD